MDLKIYRVVQLDLKINRVVHLDLKIYRMVQWDLYIGWLTFDPKSKLGNDE